uniref:RING-H2 finger protein ATL38-like n=1 Tax=Cicer arietinum TaxID=3827 RepID=A0A3Q7YBX3_CICAR|nr:RING-H2 finger protein ATL38-like [Cicer arietinum]
MDGQQHHRRRRVGVNGEIERVTVASRNPISNGVYDMTHAIPFPVPNRNMISPYVEDGHLIFCETNIHPTRINNVVQSYSRNISHDLSQDGHYIFQENNVNQSNQILTRRNVEESTHNFERIKIEEKMITETTTTCSICLVDFSIGSTAIRLPSPCSHIFHENCIMKWFNISSTCPLCRRSIS